MFIKKIILLVPVFMVVNQLIAQVPQDPKFIWAYSFGGIDEDGSRDVAVDNLGNIIEAGFFEGTVRFGNIELISSGKNDIFIAKFSSEGAIIWAVKAGGPEEDEAISVAIDNLDNIIITGTFTGNAKFNSTEVSSLGSKDVFTAKYSSTGNLLWVEKGQGAGEDYGYDVTVDNLNNVVVTGKFTESIKFRDSVLSSGNAFLIKYDSEGTVQWVDYIDGDSNPVTDYSITANNNNDIFLSGSFTENAIFGDTTLFTKADSTDIFFAKYNSDGIPIWVKEINGGSIYVYDIKTDNEGNLFLTGGFSGTFSFAESNLNNSNSVDNLFLAKCDTAGDPLWIIKNESMDGRRSVLSIDAAGNIAVMDSKKFIKGLSNESEGEIWSLDLSSFQYNGIANDKNGDIIISGSFQNNFNFGSGLLESKGQYDIFVGKISSSFSYIVVNLPNIIEAGSKIGVSITLQNPQFQSGRFFYKRSGESSYQPPEPLGSSSNINIPGDYSTIRGVVYYVEFSDGINTITYPANDPINNPASIQINIPEISYQINLEPAVYRMISIPLSLPDSKLSSVLEDDYNSYNNLFWRVFRWNPNPNIEDYQEYPNINSDFQPGNAFWLITREGKGFDINGARSVQGSSAYTITLLPGYNQISNPFAFPVAWNNIINHDLVRNPISVDNDNFNVTILNPWEGYWVYNDSIYQINLRIPPVESQGGTLGKYVYEKISKDDFVLQIKSNLELTNIQDYQNYVGMSNNAKDGYDKFDILEPPPITNDLRLSILSESKEYAQNIVSSSPEGAFWDIKINTQLENKNVTLLFEERTSLPENFKMWLLDKEIRSSVPIINNRVSVNICEKKEKFLRLIIGTDEFAKEVSENIPLLPSEYVLFQNFPNPFNPETNISYTLKERSIVSLEIFDILGRKVKSLLTQEFQNAGLQNVKWDGTNYSGIRAASGIYIYQLKANTFIASKKMILLK